MPASQEALAATNGYRARLLTLRERTAATVAASWLALPEDDLDEGYQAWLAASVGLLEGVKRQGVILSDAYLAAYVGAEMGQAPQTVGIDSDPYMETADGRPLERALLTPLFTVKAGLAAGRSDAFRLGLVRATRIVAEEVLDAPRRALGDLMGEHPGLTGWRRVTSGTACGACLASATGGVHSFDEPFRRHGHCRCSREAVVRGVRERYRRPTGREVFDSKTPEERAALFHGRGGAEKADLVASGAVPFDALVKRERMAVTDDQYTEASLADLRAMAPAQGATPGHDH